jgi:hypothetical protein
MVEQLFGSKTRVKLLKLFYSNPNRSFYVREITRKIDEQINSVRRELSNLLSIGIIKSEDTNNRLYYEVNQSYDFYKPLGMIFGGGEGIAVASPAATDTDDEIVMPTTPKAVTDPVLAELLQIGNVDVALYVNQTQLGKFMAALEEKEKKEIRFVSMSPTEFNYRRQVKDRFIANVLAAKKQVLIDKHQIIEEE